MQREPALSPWVVPLDRRGARGRLALVIRCPGAPGSPCGLTAVPLEVGAASRCLGCRCLPGVVFVGGLAAAASVFGRVGALRWGQVPTPGWGFVAGGGGAACGRGWTTWTTLSGVCAPRASARGGDDRFQKGCPGRPLARSWWGSTAPAMLAASGCHLSSRNSATGPLPGQPFDSVAVVGGVERLPERCFQLGRGEHIAEAAFAHVVS